MKLLISFIFLFGFILNSQAEIISCTAPALEVYYSDFTELADDYELSKDTIDCLKENSSFIDILGEMCNSSGKLSSDYEIYLSYAMSFKNKLQEIENATSPVHRDVLSSDARAINNEWIALGGKYELVAAVNSISKIIRNECYTKID